MESRNGAAVGSRRETSCWPAPRPSAPQVPRRWWHRSCRRFHKTSEIADGRNRLYITTVYLDIMLMSRHLLYMAKILFFPLQKKPKSHPRASSAFTETLHTHPKALTGEVPWAPANAAKCPLCAKRGLIWEQRLYAETSKQDCKRQARVASSCWLMRYSEAEHCALGLCAHHYLAVTAVFVSTSESHLCGQKKKKKLVYRKEDTRSVNPPIQSQPCSVWTKLMSGYWWTSTHWGWRAVQCPSSQREAAPCQSQNSQFSHYFIFSEVQQVGEQRQRCVKKTF